MFLFSRFFRFGVYTYVLHGRKRLLHLIETDPFVMRKKIEYFRAIDTIIFMQAVFGRDDS